MTCLFCNVALMCFCSEFAQIKHRANSLSHFKVQNIYERNHTVCAISITAAVYDVNHFPEIREKYNVMSVPCLVVDDGRIVTFGKKNIRQLVDILK